LAISSRKVSQFFFKTVEDSVEIIPTFSGFGTSALMAPDNIKNEIQRQSKYFSIIPSLLA